MPRRPPPSSLRLVQGPLPVRGQAKHTLPSVPRPVLVPKDISRSTTAPEPRVVPTLPPSPPSVSVYSRATTSTHTTSEIHNSIGHGRPRRRAIERGLESSGLALPSLGSASGSAFGANAVVGSGSGGLSSSSSTFSLSPSTTPSSESSPSSQPMRGPWDHSRAVSLSIDVGSVLALPKPVAISP